MTNCGYGLPCIMQNEYELDSKKKICREIDYNRLEYSSCVALLPGIHSAYPEEMYAELRGRVRFVVLAFGFTQVDAPDSQKKVFAIIVREMDCSTMDNARDARFYVTSVFNLNPLFDPAEEGSNGSIEDPPYAFSQIVDGRRGLWGLTQAFKREMSSVYRQPRSEELKDAVIEIMPREDPGVFVELEYHSVNWDRPDQASAHKAEFRKRPGAVRVSSDVDLTSDHEGEPQVELSSLKLTQVRHHCLLQ
jgi:hypothetical protein